MKNQNIVFIAIAFALAFALAPVTKAAPSPGGIPSGSPPAATANQSATLANSTGPDAVELPVITIHSAGNILRGKTGSFVLNMKPALMLGGMYVNFKVSGTAVAGVDYRALLSPARIGQSGYGVISFTTLPDARGSFNHQAYSVVVTLEPGAGYAVGKPSSAVMWISTSCVLEACW
jgi:hypothetical protein